MTKYELELLEALYDDPYAFDVETYEKLERLGYCKEIVHDSRGHKYFRLTAEGRKFMEGFF